MRSLSTRVVPVFHHVFQATLATGKHTFVIDGDRNNVHATGARGADSIHIGIVLAQKTFPLLNWVPALCPFVVEGLQSLCKAIGISHGQNYIGTLGVRDIGMEVFASELPEEPVQGRITLGGTILQRRAEIDLCNWICGA